MTKKYELLLVLPGTLDEKEAAKQIQEIKESLTSQAQDIELNNLGKVRLAYPIKQIRYGYYYTVIFNAEPEVVINISNKLKLRSDILRSMITLFNTNVTATKKIMYSTNEVGVTTMMEREEGASPSPKSAPVSKPVAEETKVDLKDIDEKLNAILENENIIPGV
ncbi:MAG: 30S ribosomal protein S6 [Candidatus Magasanikbacteria bacterium RIFOXYD1_FULL_40_23]|uniref:Small ribosomal subunit protein bS6 n=1 Tax=Candidatus Magasanikbacteria bacterium RIFOXYD1_FULL_40_23 TaxID=1798705 RepID=A0A1F6P7T7_9BACT|nr:MAG: 30S ribosomal protein S6 [Candidatus Magasanikbacteria bacterium RIFOXYD1_FULL_40_23]